MTQDALALYTKYYVSTSYERLGLFTLVAASFASRRALYPGSLLTLHPPSSIQHTCFVDTERRASDFFADPAVRDYVNERKCIPKSRESASTELIMCGSCRSQGELRSPYFAVRGDSSRSTASSTSRSAACSWPITATETQAWRGWIRISR